MTMLAPVMRQGGPLGLAELRAACAPGGVRAAYQPLVRLSDGSPMGFEALGRVVDDRGMGPLGWLELAAGHGMRLELELAFLRAAGENGPPPGGVPLFVNVSAATLMDPRIEEILRSLPTCVLELSEHDRVEEYATVLPRLQRWRSHGTLIAIDDVGAGYASMAHVLSMEPAYIKIDRSIVAGLDGDPRRRALVAALQTLAGASGAVTVAEGVEREEEVTVLRELGVEAVQGYLFARPGPAWPAVAPLGLAVPAFRADLSTAADARACAQRTAAAIAADPELLPSIYLARGGRLRCLARHGQWLVLDGIEPGLGLTGTAFSTGEEVLVQDVGADPRYRLAVPGVQSELALPLHAGGRLVGVLNVDALRPLSHQDVLDIRRATAALEQRLTVVGVGEEQDSVLERLGRSALPIAMAEDLGELAERTALAALELGAFDTACLWAFPDPGGHEVLYATGADADLLRSAGSCAVESMRDLVRDVASCHSAGPDLDADGSPNGLFAASGVAGFVLIPVRSGRHLIGLLALTRRGGARAVTSAITEDVVQAAEILGLQTGSRAAALERLQDLERRALLDPLTGLPNRTSLDRLIADLDGCERAVGGWLAAIDLDRFKNVNDVHGHAAGDEVLRAVAQALAAVAGCTLQVRLGGDEFVLLLEPCPEADARALCAEVRSRVRPLLRDYGSDLSVGLAPVTSLHGLGSALIRADEALYRRKGLGGAGVTTAH